MSRSSLFVFVPLLILHLNSTAKLCERGSVYSGGRNLLDSLRGQLVLLSFSDSNHRSNLDELTAIASSHPHIRFVVLFEGSEGERKELEGRYRRLYMRRDNERLRERLNGDTQRVLIYDRCGRLSRIIPLSSKKEVEEELKRSKYEATCGWCHYGIDGKKIKAYLQERPSSGPLRLSSRPPTVPSSSPTVPSRLPTVPSSSPTVHRYHPTVRPPRYPPSSPRSPQPPHSSPPYPHPSQSQPYPSQQQYPPRVQYPPNSPRSLPSQVQYPSPLHSHSPSYRTPPSAHHPTPQDPIRHDFEKQIQYHQHPYNAANNPSPTVNDARQEEERRQGMNEQRRYPTEEELRRVEEAKIRREEEEMKRNREEEKRSEEQRKKEEEREEKEELTALNMMDYDDIDTTKDDTVKTTKEKEEHEWVAAVPFYTTQPPPSAFPNLFSIPSPVSSAPSTSTPPTLFPANIKTSLPLEYSAYDDYAQEESEMDAENVEKREEEVSSLPRSLTSRHASESDVEDEEVNKVEVPCKAVTDDICYHQKKSGHRLSRCCKKGVYLSDFCMPGKCSNRTVQACCVQKYLQARFHCCEDSSLEGTTATDSFSRCCHAQFTQEDECCPSIISNDYWHSVHDICLPNTNIDLSSIKFEVRLTDGIRVMDLSETDKWKYACKYGTKRAQFVYVP